MKVFTFSSIYDIIFIVRARTAYKIISRKDATYMSRKFNVEVIIPEGLKAGDAFTLEVEVPSEDKKPRGQLSGLTLAEMTDEQLKREIVNAGSVLYKATQRNADPNTIKANQTRLDAAKAEKAKRAPVIVTAAPLVAGVVAPDATTDASTTVDEGAKAEI